MLDTGTCSVIMREMPTSVLKRLAIEAAAGNRIVISAITYAEMRYVQTGRKASAKLGPAIDEFVRRLDGILPLDAATVDNMHEVRQLLAVMGTPIGNNDAAIAAHALTAGCILVTNNPLERSRVAALRYEDWTQ